MPFSFQSIGLSGPLLIEPRSFPDDRGFFMELYARSAFLEAGIDDVFVQDNISVSKKNTLRGLHFQNVPKEQGKLVSVVKGRVYDVIVDIRPNSDDYGRWYGVELNSQNGRILWVPPGFAHGFLSLEEGTVFLYKVTKEYSPEHDAGIRFDDPDIGVDWTAANENFLISEKDRNLPLLREIS